MLPGRFAQVATGAHRGRPCDKRLIAGRAEGTEKPRAKAPGSGFLAGLLLWSGSLSASFDASGAAIWRSPTSGFWSDGTNWTSPTAPSLATGGVYITNQTAKTVTVDEQTPMVNLFINSLNVWGPTETTNTLLLTGGTTNRPLVVSNQTLTVTAGGQVVVTNSSLVVTGRFLGFNVWAGEVRLESGSIVAREAPLTTNVSVVTRIGRTNVGTLTIHGGYMEVTDLYLGESPGPRLAKSHGRLQMNGGLLNVNGEFSLGKSASCTGTVEIAGGQILVPNNLTNILRVGDAGTGLMTVSNAVVSAGDVSVGRHDGALGTLMLQSGGEFIGSDDFSIGRFNGATGLVDVTGGHLSTSNSAIWVGREGSGELNLSNGLVSAVNLYVAAVPTNLSRGVFNLTGGQAQLFSNFMVGATSIATGQVTVRSGTLIVTNTATTASLNVQAGTFTCDGGDITVDQLSLLQTRGRFIFNGGTLRCSGSVVSNGLPFVVGDGLRPATLHLLGGTHVFADGLILSSNATLSGCGTVIGTLVSHGTDSRNCGSTSGPPVITQQPASLVLTQGATAVFSVQATGPGPLSYQWRFGVPGTGGGNIPGATQSTLTLRGVQSTNAGNYRVMVSNASGVATSVVATLRVLVSPVIGQAVLSGSGFEVSFPSVNALTYFLEFKDRLDAPTWTPLGSAPGTGSMLTLMDASPAVPVRFYRVRVE